MTVVVDAGDGRIIEFPDEATANEFFASENSIDQVVDQPSGQPIATQQEISTEDDMKAALKSGLVRGAIAIPELGEMATRGAIRAGQGVYELFGGEVDPQYKPEILKSEIGDVLRGAMTADDYQAQTTAGKYAGTIGEFLPAAVGGPAGLLRRAATATVAGAGSEAAGQAAEGTDYEIPARIIGAFASPVAGAKIANKTILRSVKTPTVDTLRDAKNAAYSAVDKSGATFKANEINSLITKSRKTVDEFNYVPDVDLQTKAALKVLENQMNKPLTIGELDKIRQGLYKRYNAAPNEVGIRAIIDDIDDLIETSGPSSKIMKTAREANKRYKKTELLDDAFAAASRNTAVSGSGGNLVNNYRRAVKNILNNKRTVRYFDPDEINVMEQFVQGKFSENAMRLIGKMAPSGGGLMQALNIGAIAYNPAMAGVSLAGIGAKAGAEASAMKNADELLRMVSTGVKPENRKSFEKAFRIFLGLSAQQEQ